ncbi:hypothetical protein HanXRQr2_Chr10g0450921 [Helianthus annuus]|uniref:Uncharacterized protein n=1 Tax=Helianthus annuus TaxID=4232 RepID=A0A251TNT8_HELAN|nr:hypothetical protein HanXRQr2_Chr10g0450921 [Helianthus annuus]
MAVDNSSSSPSFRELADVFLQSQARIWHGEVLRTRFDEQISTCDLLSDGELLYVLTLYFNSKLYCYFISIPV